MFNLFTSFFHPKTETRYKEFAECFEKNINNNIIKKIYVFYEPAHDKDMPEFLRHEKIHVMNLSRRPMYSDFFDYTNKYIKGSDINIVSNTDIYFDHTLALLQNVNFENKFFCISRYNVESEDQFALQGCGDSYDVWIYKGQINISDSDIYLGISGCDTLIALKACTSGYNVQNPCLSVKTYHLHHADERNNNLSDGLNYWHAKGYDCGFRLAFCKL